MTGFGLASLATEDEVIVVLMHEATDKRAAELAEYEEQEGAGNEAR